ncbi:GNAT family N-acetyltransferase [Leptospira perolatii]|uniref:GNAT family N-acetyltransferase n=1 Tax=Leptospira perolatii TaxID=2023191 RepID=A0A2M9ZS26_9LEPT|nr:N-acetyltransferase [Leptospira perolatii]PJZ71246.1 GNAT family N-acetyltransferase [Leptospira perolatii]PJZ74779.1 GNAT family N-acetyltransferase [Leptospira perolatii]
MAKVANITIRAASRSDLDELTELFDLYHKFYHVSHDLTVIKRFLEDRLLHKDSILLVAEGQVGLLGFAQLYPTFSSLSLKRDYILNDIYVREESRRTGVAKKLLAEAGASVKRSGGKGLSLETAADNRSARKLYEGFGFRLNEEYLRYYWVSPKEK